jgi:hypothetical protein
MKKIVESLTKTINPNLGSSMCVLLMSIIVLIEPERHVWNYKLIISIILIVSMAIIIFFQIRHSWKVKKDLEKIKN